MYNASLVEKGEIGDVVYSVELWGIHLGQGVERHLADLEGRC